MDRYIVKLYQCKVLNKTRQPCRLVYSQKNNQFILFLKKKTLCILSKYVMFLDILKMF